MRPGEVIYLTSMGKNCIIMKNNSRGRIKLFNGKNSEDILELGPDCEEIDAEGESLKIANHSTDHRAITQLLLHYTYKSQTPILDFDVVPLISGDTLSLKVVNTGDVDIEKVTVNVMINGVTIGFKTIERVSKGGEAQCTLLFPRRRAPYLLEVWE
ncbi:hypothetical protein [Metallosphaera hakonensis]|uniref:hypothetical protein n=1 Tax=Metallosphaera hakonensis TaxID=79601 RepID=UPI0020920FED|nr:hypothetical protein [Metallosphaera hakonensis]